MVTLLWMIVKNQEFLTLINPIFHMSWHTSVRAMWQLFHYFSIFFQKVSQTISFIITENQSDFFLLLVFRWAFKNNQTQCAVLWFEFLCTRNTMNERLILGGLINSNMLDRKHCWCYYWLDTFRELIFAGIKFCEFRELWSLSRKLFPAKIIWKLSIYKFRDNWFCKFLNFWRKLNFGVKK